MQAKLTQLVNNKPLVLSLAFGLIAATIITVSLAASPNASLEPESSSSRDNVTVKSDASASNGQYVQFSSVEDEPEPDPGEGDWYGYTKPGPNNTGPTDDSNLTNITNSQLESMMYDGAVIENVRITGGDVDFEHDNVTIRNFIMNGNGNRYGMVLRRSGSGLTLEDGEIYNISSAAILGTGFTAKRLNIHDSSGDGIKPQNTSGEGGPVLVESSWIHKLGKGEGAHADGFQSRSGEFPIVLRGNNCDMPVNEKGGPGAPYKSNACYIPQDGAEGPIVSIDAKYNWFNGGNFTIYCGSATSNYDFSYNRFGDQYRYGIRSGTCKTWEGNVWDATGAPVN